MEQSYLALGIQTNNYAEAIGAFLALKRSIALGLTDIELRMDSLLIIEQLRGRYKIKHPELQKIHTQIRDLLRSQSNVKVRYTHIRRELNSHADRLANKGMDEMK